MFNRYKNFRLLTNYRRTAVFEHILSLIRGTVLLSFSLRIDE